MGLTVCIHFLVHCSPLRPPVLLDPGTYIYYNATMQRGREPPRNYPGNYSTDLISSKALGFLDEAAAADAPFFLGVMPIGPHTETIFDIDSPTTLPIFNPPVPADRHKDLYHGVKVPRTANFNPDQVCRCAPTVSSH